MFDKKALNVPREVKNLATLWNNDGESASSLIKILITVNARSYISSESTLISSKDHIKINSSLNINFCFKYFEI